MHLLKSLSIIFFTSFVLASCNDSKPQFQDTLSTGTIDISVDETFKPVIDEELKVFDSSYPNAHINIHYKSESECFKDYFNDSARIILVTRKLTDMEQKLAEQKKIYVRQLALARDAIAVIVNKSSADTMLGTSELKGILSGVYKKKYTVVFDNTSSSTVHFIVDSVLKGQPLGGNVFAAKGNKEVVDYVEKNPDAIGFVGLGYVSDTTDPANSGRFINTIKVVAVQNDTNLQFYQPYQAYVAQMLYPLTRKLWYINHESHLGLGTGFINFLSSGRGQLIFAHDFLFPLQMEVIIREAKINSEQQ